MTVYPRPRGLRGDSIAMQSSLSSIGRRTSTAVILVKNEQIGHCTGCPVLVPILHRICGVLAVAVAGTFEVHHQQDTMLLRTCI